MNALLALPAQMFAAFLNSSFCQLHSVQARCGMCVYKYCEVAEASRLVMQSQWRLMVATLGWILER